MSLESMSVVLIVLAAADWYWTAVIIRAARAVPEPALVERAVASAILSTVATSAAVLGAYILGFVDIPPGGRIVLLIGAFVLVSVPQFVWGTLLLFGRFR